MPDTIEPPQAVRVALVRAVQRASEVQHRQGATLDDVVAAALTAFHVSLGPRRGMAGPPLVAAIRAAALIDE